MNIIWPFLASFFASVVLTPIVAAWAKRTGLVDDPKKHKHPAVIHKRVVPRAGGAALFLSVVIASVLFVPLTLKVFGILLGGLVLVVVGLFDDKRDLEKTVKLAAQVLAALIAVGAGVGIAFITNPLSIIPGGAAEVIRLDTLRLAFNFLGEHSILIWADLFAIAWIVWVVNMVNFSSGVDGQMPGVVLVALLVLLLSSLRFVESDPSQLVVTRLAAVGMGATFGFLIFNFYPAKIFPGDSGSYFLGYWVALLAILSGAKVGTAILVMAIPLLDGVFTIVRRMTAGESPFLGDRKHLHHRLLELGWGQRRIALFYGAFCAILGAAALSLNAYGKLFAGVFIAIVILGGLLWLNMNLPQKAQK